MAKTPVYPTRQLENSSERRFDPQLSPPQSYRHDQPQRWQPSSGQARCHHYAPIQTDQKASPPSPADFSSLFEYSNSIDLRRLLRDIEIVLIESAMNRNAGNTSEASKDLKLQRTTLIEKIKNTDFRVVYFSFQASTMPVKKFPVDLKPVTLSSIAWNCRL